MIRTYATEIEGQTPLLMHWDNLDWSDEMDQWLADPANTPKSKAGDDRTPAFKWIGCCYHDGEYVCVPSSNLSRSFMDAGAMIINRGRKTFKTQTQTGMKIDERLVPLVANDSFIDWKKIANMRTRKANFSEHKEFAKSNGFSLDVRRAKIGTGKHVRVRPMFNNWSLQFSISVWDEQITKEVLEQIIRFAGAFKGLGDWRPSSKTPGAYGIFDLKDLSLKSTS